MFLFKSSTILSSSRNFRQPFLRRFISISNDIHSENSTASNSHRQPGVSRRVELIETGEQWNNIFPHISASLKPFPVLGFDCEWTLDPIPDWSSDHADAVAELEEDIIRKVRRKRSKVNLAQLATRDGMAILIRIDRMDAIPETLRNLLADSNCLKVGVESNWDAVRLQKDYPTVFESIAGSFDVRFILHPGDTQGAAYYRSRAKFDRIQLSLRSLSEIYLNRTFDKSLRITCSDWSAAVLSPEQIQYAATDAQVSIDVFFALLNSVGMDAETEEHWPSIYEHCQPYRDKGFGMKTKRNSTNYFPKLANSRADSQETDISDSGDEKR